MMVRGKISLKTAEVKQWVPGICDCGPRVGQYLAHYDVMRCSCGKFFWSLQPKRDGPLVMFPWPGLSK